MKRYLIEPESVLIQAPESETSSSSTPAPQYKVVYRIMDTEAKRMVPPESEDISVIARTCAALNEAEAAKYGGMADPLPDDIVQAIAINNAKSIDEQSAILANLALAQQIFNQNMQQQISLSHQQAMNQIKLAVVAKCVEMIDSVGSINPTSIEKVGTEVEKIVQQMERVLDGKAGNGAFLQAP